MSLQSVNDLIINSPNIETLQLTNHNTESSNVKRESFADLISFYKNESDAKTEKVPEQEVAKRPESADEKSENTVEVKKEQKTVENSVEEKVKTTVDAKIASNTKSEEKSDKKIKSPVAKKSDNKTDSKKVKNQNDEKTVVNTGRMDEILNSVTNKNLVQQFKDEIAENKDEINTELKILVVKDSENLELNQNSTLAMMNENSISEDSEKDVDFSFDKKSFNKGDVSKLDKEGKITVEDLRTEQVITESEKTDAKLKTDVKFVNENSATMTMEFAAQNVENNVLSLNDQSAAANGSNFQQMLNNQIQANVPEFVKTGSIILKDNNQGTINLILHPDDLGNVKIQLNLDGKSVHGQITVASKEALQVFKDNAEALREAFIKNGFDGASIDVAYNGGNGSQAGSNGFERQNDGRELVANKVYTNINGMDPGMEDISVDEFLENSSKSGKYSINIVA